MQQYQDIFMKLVPKLREIYGKRIEAVVLYGSVARADDTPESDWIIWRFSTANPLTQYHKSESPVPTFQ